MSEGKTESQFEAIELSGSKIVYINENFRQHRRALLANIKKKLKILQVGLRVN